MSEKGQRVALVTGGSQGIGAETVRLALGEGYRVIAFGRDEGRLHGLVSQHGVDGRLLVRPVDVADWEAVNAAVVEAGETMGRIDAVVANAGITALGDIASGDPAEWRAMVLTNVLGVAHTIKATLPAVRESRGRYVLLGSVLGRVGKAGSLYGATKHAVAALAENLRLELVGSGVGVTAIEPGIVDTPLWPQPPERALAAADVAEAILWVLGRPAGVAVNELLVRPTDQPL